jgi:muconolactone delta-isomerase
MGSGLMPAHRFIPKCFLGSVRFLPYFIPRVSRCPCRPSINFYLTRENRSIRLPRHRVGAFTKREHAPALPARTRTFRLNHTAKVYWYASRGYAVDAYTQDLVLRSSAMPSPRFRTIDVRGLCIHPDQQKRAKYFTTLHLD